MFYPAEPSTKATQDSLRIVSGRYSELPNCQVSDSLLSKSKTSAENPTFPVCNQQRSLKNNNEETQYTQDNKRNQNDKIRTNTGTECGIGQDNGQAKAGPTEDHYPDLKTLILPPEKQNGESSAEFLL